MFSPDRRLFLGSSLALCGLAATPSRALAPGKQPLNSRLKGYLTELHDPVIIKEGATYHVFGSGCWNKKASPSWRISRDLETWTDNGNVFDALPAWAAKAVPGAQCYWAPDITYVNGLYRMYYSVSTGGSMRSVTGFATTPTLDRKSPRYKWTDHGLVIETFPTGTYNAIDANFAIDLEGNHWLSFGSYWSGLKIIRLDKKTGKRPVGDDAVYPIAFRPTPRSGGENPIEAPFIFERGGWLYLFASYDYCCRGAASNYYVSVGRSKDIRGPYLSRDGKSMMDGYGTQVLVEHPFGSTQFRGPGHCGLMRDGNRDLIVYHAEHATDNTPVLRIAELEWTSDGWPVAVT
jgi:arabinan endo-1,5-alpha-L-arabinosidase